MISKRTKSQHSNPKSTSSPNASRIFQPFRALGLITTSVPFSLQSMGSEFFVSVPVDRTFQVFDCKNFRLKMVGQQLTDSISEIIASGESTFVSHGPVITKYSRADVLGCMQVDDSQAEVVEMLQFGQQLVVLYTDNTLRVWHTDSLELFTEIQFQGGFEASTLFHPSTYLNKILIGGADGRMQLWNIRTRKLIHEFKGFQSGVTTIAQSPAVDIVAVGLVDGRILLHDLRQDKILLQFKQEERVTSISFRTDEHPMMASATSGGDIALWNLEERRLAHIMRAAHDGCISKIEFLPGKPLLISSGSDNALKQWIFNALESDPRLLRYRSGHHAPPTSIRYYDNEGKFILSAGRDRAVRLFSVFRDEQNVELSQGSLQKKATAWNLNVDELKLPYPIQFASSNVRERDWDNVISCHLNSSVAQLWSFERKATGKFKLSVPDQSHIKCVAISRCGNFCLTGSNSGRVDVFNMQSGQHRKEFLSHSKSVTNVVMDAENRLVISSGLDAVLNFWDFQKGTRLEQIQYESPISHILLHDANDLLALACDDLGIRVVDIQTKRVVREFWGHAGPITDLAYSPDGRWLVSSAVDSTIRVWDIPSGYCIDRFRVKDIATSLSFSPTGDFLASTHVNSVGVFLWANKSQYTHIELARVRDEEEMLEVQMPSMNVNETTAQQDEDGMDVDIAQANQGSDIRVNYKTPEQLSEDLITLSIEPKSKWMNLLHIDTIKKRNKPKEAPKAPEKAPFFLPTVPGLEPKFAITKGNEEAQDSQSRLLRFGELGAETELTLLLQQEDISYDAIFEHLKSLAPAALDFELRSIPLMNDCQLLKRLLHVYCARMELKRDFELTQTYIAVTLKIYGDIFAENSDIFNDPLKALLIGHESCWSTVEKLFQSSMCMVDFIRNQ